MTLIGHSIAHYEITGLLGTGGMGEVYRATDTRLGREVALKVLPASMAGDAVRLKRFRQEARAAAALNHPHIVTLYSVERDGDVEFLTMEVVDGETLDRAIPEGGMAAAQVAELGRALAEALFAAHERHIIHRDLKPSNIMVTRDGRVKVLDFGLAKAMAAEDATDATATHLGLTRVGAILGTPQYMSPEQLVGGTVDARSDIFALGIVLHQMATGRRPFAGKTSAELATAILRDAPPLLTKVRPHTPPELAALIHRCIEKDPGQRPQSAREIAGALRAIGDGLRMGSATSAVVFPNTASHGDGGSEARGGEASASRTGPSRLSDSGPSIAVMPFQSLSTDPENEYFSDGLAEEILNALSGVEGLTVASRASSFWFKNKPAEVSEIAGKLHVANLLQGSVRRAGNRLRVTVQMVDASNGFQLWSERYDRQMEDVFEIQEEIARGIAERLKVTLGASARPVTTNTEAYEMYLKGRHFWHLRSPNSIRSAMECFAEAIRLDAGFALAYAGLTDCYGILQFYGWVPAEVNREKARAAVTEALRLDPQRWEVQYSAGLFKFYFEREWRSGEPHLREAISIAPRAALAHVALALISMMAGRSEEGLEEAHLACRLDPLSALIHGIAAGTMNAIEQFEEGERLARRALELQPEYLFGLWSRAVALARLHRYEEAVNHIERAAAISRAPVFLGLLGWVYAQAGRLADAERVLGELEERSSRGEYVPAFSLFNIYMGLKDIPAMQATLARAIAERVAPLSLVLVGLHLDEARSDPEIDRMHRELFGW
ncbi:MAG: protein kinase [Acidobacteriaceae bacterium]